MKYKLETAKPFGSKKPLSAGVSLFLPYIQQQRGKIVLALVTMTTSSVASLLAPVIISRAVDTYVRLKDMDGLIRSAAVLMAIYLVGIWASYTQIRTMGGVGRRVLFNLRASLFAKLQELPLAFFTENKAGDLISRVNNDTDKLNQFVAQSLMQFMSTIFVMTGAAIFAVSLNWRMGLVALAPAAAVLLITKATAAWVKAKNVKSLQSLGGLSSEVQESLQNFRVIVAFHRMDYFQRKFEDANARNYTASTSAGFANNIFMPMYGLAHHIAQLLVIAYGITLIASGQLTAGLLIGFLLYVNNFYGPMRQLATVWASFQLAIAALERIVEVLALTSDMPLAPATQKTGDAVLEFQNVTFQYPGGKDVLRGVNLVLEQGKAYALVGPTGGGKTTTASLMARLYDPTSGTISWRGESLQSIPPAERARKIGVITQEPFLFSGTVHENIVYGNPEYANSSPEQLSAALEQANLSALMSRFPEGLSTKVATTGTSISLGQKQLIAFMRAVLRKPELLILDEATANIDTVTEQLLEEILAKLPKETTRVIIAHRLNTIDNVDQIFFVNSGTVTPAGSMEHAVNMLLHEKRSS